MDDPPVEPSSIAAELSSIAADPEPPVASEPAVQADVPAENPPQAEPAAQEAAPVENQPPPAEPAAAQE